MNERPPDPDSLLYHRYWEPVLAGPAARMLERIDTEPGVVLDIGAGTGSVSLMAAARWPQARIIGVDASAGMLSVARYRVDVDRPDELGRFEWRPADAADIPLDDELADVVTSSFMLQLVDDRSAVLAEVLRVLRPGGTFAMVTWIAEELLMSADDAFNEVVERLGFDEPTDGFRPSKVTDYQRLSDASEELEAAGFERVEVVADDLHHAWTRDEYLTFKRCYDDRELFDELERSDRDRLIEQVRVRWAELPDSAFEISGPLVCALARKPS